jgi:uncharacterized protein YyaL (SSP411 family)
MANRLAGATSPYLLQHQDNPVDWWEWGDEAFAEAQKRDCPVLLSVGYSACHWCHVMAHESFEDRATAAFLNDHFVCIKVDREERPDIDSIYMAAVQALTGQGGWPMTVFLTPDGRPFYGGTYFPKEEGRGLPSFLAVLRAIDNAWRVRRPEVRDQADALSRVLGARPAPRVTDDGSGQAASGKAILSRARVSLRAAHDDQFGGFGQAPKFPQPSLLEVLLRAHFRHRDEESLAMITTTLDAMASGGIYDHLGGGFARYSVDRTWTVPHFEKMLYDQAGLALAYLHAWQLTGEQRWRQVMEETVGYVLSDLALPEGGVAASEDADSEGVEGKFYVWRPEELEEVLGPDLARMATDWWGVTPAGNFEGSTILHRPVRGALARPPEIEEARRLLFEARSCRVRPGRDDKVLTEWNAMFCSTLAQAAAATGREDWAETATSLADFLVSALRRPADGRWMRSWHHGRANHLAYATDYAWLVDAFVRLAELTGRARFVALARETADAMLELFGDEETGGLLTAGHDAPSLVVAARDIQDGATPSAGSVAALALLRLEALTGQAAYGTAARRLLSTVQPLLAAQPLAVAHSLLAIDLLDAGITEIAVVGPRRDLVQAVHGRWLPHAVLAWGEPFPSPLWESRPPGAAYVCQGFTCGPPALSVEGLVSQL